jgi:flagellar hook protein FlgE
MIGGISNGLSALNALTTKFASNANNIANSNSVGYKATRVTLSANSGGGVTAEVSKDDSPGPLAIDGGGGAGATLEMSNVNLAEEMVGMIVTQRSYEANVKAIKTSDEMLGTLLDLKR